MDLQILTCKIAANAVVFGGVACKYTYKYQHISLLLMHFGGVVGKQTCKYRHARLRLM